MRLLDRYIEGRFRVLRDGSTVFMPKGDSGPAYLVPDEATRKRFEFLTKCGGVVTSLLLFSGAKLLYHNDAFNWGWAALLLFVPLWPWWVARHAAERLQQVHDTSLFDAPNVENGEYKEPFLWARATAAVGAVIIGLILSSQAPVAWVRWVSLAVAFVAAMTLPFTINDLQHKRELDARERERAGGWFHDSAYTRRRRFF